MKTKNEIQEEIEATKRTIANYDNSYKNGKIPLDVLDSVKTACFATINALNWVLDKNNRFD